ncbi:MAG TPA: sulfatase-like hydrolase/transferase [Thermoanaerobaculia bacterium]|nr:sulfatase-like hydrolase/transferase [Thermoanaerobaculia bacterium]
MPPASDTRSSSEIRLPTAAPSPPPPSLPRPPAWAAIVAPPAIVALAALAALAAIIALGGCGPLQPPNRGGPVVLITLEALRADVVSGLGGEPGLTPNLAALIRQADWAGRAVAPSSWGVPAMATLFTGLSPWQHHAMLDGDNAHLAQDLVTLPKAFKALGYHTTGFAGGHWYTAAFGYDRGFDSLDEEGRNRDAAEHLASLAEGKELVWVHMPEPQAPYVRRDWLLPRLGRADRADLPPTVEPVDLLAASNPEVPAPPALRQRLGSMYRLNVAWADEKVGRLLDALRASGQWERALIVVTSAFGEEIGERGAFGHGGDLERESIEVPLIVKLPSWCRRPIVPPAGQRIALARVWATLVEAAGGKPAPAPAPSLFRAAPAAVLSELYLGNGVNLYSLVEGDDQLVWQARFAPTEPRLYRASLEALAGTAGANPRDGLGVIAARLFDGFEGTPPLGGLGPPALALARWGAGGGSRRVADPRRTAELARRLAARWGDFIAEELTPGAEDREWSDQMPPPAPEPAEGGGGPGGAPGGA